jgi:hypothetical protein
MAIEFELFLETRLTPRHIFELILNSTSVNARIEPSDKGEVFICIDESELTMRVFAPESVRHHILEQSLAVRPTVCVLFRFEKFGDTEVQKTKMLRLSFELLERVPGNVALLFNGEIVWFLRRDGELILNKNVRVWDSHLDLLTLAYEMRDIPAL